MKKYDSYYWGKNSGLKSQGEYLSELLKKNGYEVLNITESKNKLKRLIDVYYNIRTNSKNLKLIILQVYGTKSIILEILILFLAKKLGIKTISHIHGGSIPNIYKRKKILFNYIFKNSIKIITPSNYLKLFTERIGFKAEIIHNLIEENKYKNKNRDKIGYNIIWMRNFSKIYNPKMAVLTIQELVKRNKRVTLYMAGYDGGQKNFIKNLVKNLKLEENIKILGVLNEEEKQKYADISDIYINTNNIDNTPVTVIEMIEFGLNIVTTNAGGIKYMLENGKNAIIVNKNEPTEMANAIEGLIKNQEIARKQREQAKRENEKYKEKNVMEKWKNIINEIIEK